MPKKIVRYLKRSRYPYLSPKKIIIIIIIIIGHWYMFYFGFYNEELVLISS